MAETLEFFTELKRTKIIINFFKQVSVQNAFLNSFVLIIFFIVLRTVSQIFLKQVALGPGGASYFALFFDPLFYLAGMIYLAQAMVWLIILKRLPLSFAYPFTSVTLITIMISGAVFFGEAITLGNVLGTVIIIAGVIVIAGDHEKNTVQRINR